jgi:hypothetical protein
MRSKPFESFAGAAAIAVAPRLRAERPTCPVGCHIGGGNPRPVDHVEQEMKPGRALVLIAAAALGTVGCARVTPGNAGSGDIEHPTGPGEVVVRVERCCGFVPVEYSLTDLPGFSLMGDGRVIETGPQIEIYPGPALPNVLVRQIEEPGVQAILQAAFDAGLQGPDRHYDQAMVADAATTTFTVAANGDVHGTKVYALEEERGATGDEQDAREKLRAFSQKLGDLERWLPEGSVGQQQAFEFEALRVFVIPTFPEGGEELPQKEQPWPLDTPLSSFGDPLKGHTDVRCGVVEGPDLEELRPLAKKANQLTPWRSEGDVYHLVFRPLLPDEFGC